MKRLLIGLAIAAIAAFNTLPVSAETTIRVTLQLPEKHSLGQNWLAFKKIVEEKSEGELKIELFPSAQLYKDKQVPEAVGSGAIEAGSAFLGPATKGGSEIREILDAAVLKETGARVLWWQAFGRNIYLSKDAPIRVPADLKGKKVRTYGKILGWTVEALGGAPTLMSGSKQFLAYQQGAVDVGMTGAATIESRKLYEVMNHATLSYDSAVEFVAIINNKFFEGLSKKNQDIILDAAATVEQDLRDYIYANETVVVDGVRSKINIIELTEAERDQWRQATKGVGDRFAKERGDIAAQVIKAARSL
jgi:C4-dicarboxylate-binding protein DctP